MTDYNKIEIIKKQLEELLLMLGINAVVKYEESILKGLVFNISSPESYLLIGKQGSTLQALQILLQNLVTKKFKAETIRFFLDVDDYKIKREWFLKETAKGAAEQVLRNNRSVRLEPMPSFERRFIHAFLQEHFSEIYSQSIGEGPYRRVIVSKKN